MSKKSTLLKTLLVIFILWIPDIVFCQSERTTNHNHWGLGVKFSNPSGINVKKYFGNKALELSAGRLNSWKSYSYYYREHKHDLKRKGYTFEGFDHVYPPLAIQLHYLIHKDVSLFKGLQWYYGLGGQFRASEYYYEYSYEEGSVVYHRREKEKSIGIGVDAVAGLEYTFANFPLTLFYDANVYVEGFMHPLYLKVQSGLGFRYNFK